MGENRQVDELRSLARLGFDELRRATGGIGNVHRAVAERAFGASGRGALPARALHDAISSGVYAGLGGAARVAGIAADAGLGRRAVPDGRRLSASPRGALLVGALNGLIGDTLERAGSDLQPSASGRSRTRRVPFEEEYGAHVGGTHHLALLNHPRVYELMLGWLENDAREAEAPARPAPA